MKYKKEDIVTCTVTGIEEYGIFVKLDDNCTGLIHISEISKYFVKEIDEYAKIEDILTAKVIEVEEDKNRLKLSLKALEKSKKKKKREPIKETNLGFKTLSDNLSKWIEEKYN